MAQGAEFQLMNVKQAAEFLGLSARYVRRLAKDNVIHGEKLGGRDYLFTVAELERFRDTPRRGVGRPRKGNE